MKVGSKYCWYAINIKRMNLSIMSANVEINEEDVCSNLQEKWSEASMYILIIGTIEVVLYVINSNTQMI